MTTARKLVAIIETYESTVVAFSGGVDSALVASAAHRALGPQALAILSDSPTLPRRELMRARETAAQIGIRLVELARDELSDPRFVQNDAGRCGICKAGLAQDLAEFARKHGFATFSLGVNRSDFGDWRPGIDAARSQGAKFPLAEAGLAKQDVRKLAWAWGLDVWNKPAAPCLSSRVAYGQPVTKVGLGMIEHAEDAVRDLGVRDVRVRLLGQDARIEVEAGDLPVVQGAAKRLASQLRNYGFNRIEIDDRPLVSGRLSAEAGLLRDSDQ